MFLEIEGVLVNTATARYRALSHAWEPHGTMGIDADECAELPFTAAIRHLALAAEIPLDQTDIDLLGLRAEDAFIAQLSDGIELVPGALEAFDRLVSLGTVSIVSAACRRAIDVMLRAMSRDYAVAFIVAGDDPVAPKPSPAPYLRARDKIMARHRAIAPRMVAIEWGTSGIDSARAADLPVINVAADRYRRIANATVDSLADIDLGLLDDVAAPPVHPA